MKHAIAAFWLGLLTLTSPAAAQQQQLWAAAYIDWRFPSELDGIDRVAQDIAVLEPARASFFTLNWDFATGDGGYIGLQSDVDGAGNARFSLWNARAARGEACRPFDGEGIGMTCVFSMPIEPDRFYRLRILRAYADASGQWWSGWIDAISADGQTHSTKIGDLQVAADRTAIAPGSIYNFSEYWGDAVRACRDVPLSVAAFLAPAAQRGDEDRGVIAEAPAGRRPDGHPCATGLEQTGAVASHVGISHLGAPAMIMVLGGNETDNRTHGAQAARSLPSRRPGN